MIVYDGGENMDMNERGGCRGMGYDGERHMVSVSSIIATLAILTRIQIAAAPYIHGEVGTTTPRVIRAR